MSDNKELVNTLQTIENKNLATTTNEELAEFLPYIRGLSNRVWSARSTIENLLIERMEQDNATKIVNGGVTITLQTQKTKEINDEILKELLDILSEEDKNKAVNGYVIQWNNKHLRELAKRGGRISEIISSAIKVKEKPYLKVDSKPQFNPIAVNMLKESSL